MDKARSKYFSCVNQPARLFCTLPESSLPLDEGHHLRHLDSWTIERKILSQTEAGFCITQSRVGITTLSTSAIAGMASGRSESVSAFSRAGEARPVTQQYASSSTADLNSSSTFLVSNTQRWADGDSLTDDGLHRSSAPNRIPPQNPDFLQVPSRRMNHSRVGQEPGRQQDTRRTEQVPATHGNLRRIDQVSQVTVTVTLPPYSALDRFDDFVLSLPVEAADRAIANTYDAARRAGRAASRRLEQFSHRLNRNDRPSAVRTVTSPAAIGAPTLVQWDNLQNHRLVSLEAAQAEALALSQEWARSQPRAPSPPAAPEPVTIGGEATSRPRRRVIESNWGAVIEAAQTVPPLPDDGCPEEGAEAASQMLASSTACAVGEIKRKPVPIAARNKPLPTTPRFESLRRKPVSPGRTTEESMDGSALFDRRSAASSVYSRRLSGTTIRESMPKHLFDNSSEPSEEDIVARQAALLALEGGPRANTCRTDYVPIVDQFVHDGHVSTHVNGESVASWQVPQAYSSKFTERMDSPMQQPRDSMFTQPPRLGGNHPESSVNQATRTRNQRWFGDTRLQLHLEPGEKDDAADVWDRLEAAAGYRMRD